MKSNGKNKRKNQNWVIFLFALMLIFFIYPFVKNIRSQINIYESAINLLLFLVIIFVPALIFIFLHIIIHEAGHLIFGLLSGYKFVSFRILSFMWCSQDGKIVLKRVRLPGTSGQCLMSPPEFAHGKIPYRLYNLGGSLLNFIFSIIAIIIAIIMRTGMPGIVISLLIYFAGIGMYTGLSNAFPLTVSGINNDGKNALYLGKDSEALKTFYIMLKVNEYTTNGAMFKDMPDDYFILPSEEGLKNAITANRIVFVCGRVMENGNYENAADIIDWFMEQDNALPMINIKLLKLNRLYCEIVGQRRPDYINALYSKEQQMFIKIMGGISPDVVHTNYAYKLLIEGDTSGAQQLKANFFKKSVKYPYKGDIKRVLEMMDFADRCAG